MKRTLQQVIEYLKLTQNQIVCISPELIGIHSSSDMHIIKLEGVSTDTRTIESNQLYIPLIGISFDGHAFRNTAYEQGSIVSVWDKSKEIPDIPGVYLLVEDTLEALQSLAYEYRQSLSVKVIAITGSNGKTSTKDFVASVLKQCYKVSQTKGNLNNHIGVPLTLLRIQEDDEYAVIELGMNHYGEIRTLTKIAVPDYGIMTNIGESHIENFQTKENIGTAKFELFDTMESGIAIINGDDPIIKQLASQILKTKTIEVFTYGILSNELDIKADIVSSTDILLSNTIFKVQNRGIKVGLDERKDIEEMEVSITTPGSHNVYNALAAITIGLLTKVPMPLIQIGLTKVKITSMRMEITKHLDSYIINDAYNASPTSMKAAISFLSNIKEPYKKIALLGDMKELGDQADAYHKQIGTELSGVNIDMVIAYGEKAIHYLSPLQEANYFPIGKEEQLRILIEQELTKGCILLIKGSRSMKLEQFININSIGSSEKGE